MLIYLSLFLVIAMAFCSGYLTCGATWLPATRGRRMFWTAAAVLAMFAAVSAAIHWVA